MAVERYHSDLEEQQRSVESTYRKLYDSSKSQLLTLARSPTDSPNEAYFLPGLTGHEGQITQFGLHLKKAYLRSGNVPIE